jgi:23S rRNA (uridine2552-2'-O)-methyltransferase
MTRWYSEKKKEFYYNKAKREGYRARSAFKLLQIHNKFSIFNQGDVVLDLGAAPGGWSQVARKLIGNNGIVIGIDLSFIEPLEGALFLQGDVANKNSITELKNKLAGRKVHVVLSDMSPNISGNYSVDQARSVFLCEQALIVAREFLAEGGKFICKIFTGSDLPEFINEVKTSFGKLWRFSPSASRKSSSEIYLIAKEFKPKHNHLI